MTLKSCIDCKHSTLMDWAYPLNLFRCSNAGSTHEDNVVAVTLPHGDQMVSHVSECPHFYAEDFQG